MKSKKMFSVAGGLTAQALGLLFLFSVSGCAHNGDPMLDNTFIEISEDKQKKQVSVDVPPTNVPQEFEWEFEDSPVIDDPVIDVPEDTQKDTGKDAVDTPTVVPPTPVPATPKVPPAAASATYKVQKGDSLWKISRIYGVTQQQLAEANGISVKDIIHPGQILNIPAGGSNITKPKTYTPEKTAPKKTAAGNVTAGDLTYVVVAGDSLSVIAHRHGVKTAALQAVNNLDIKKPIFVGQKLVIPAGGKAPQKQPAKVTENKQPASTAKAPAASAQKPVVKDNAKAAATQTPAASTAANKGQSSASVDDVLSQAINDIDTNVIDSPVSNAPAGNTASSSAEEDVLPVVIDRDMTIEEVASGFGRSLEEVKKLNPKYKPGEKIKSQSTVLLPFF